MRVGSTLVQQVRSTLDPASAQPAGGHHAASGWLVVTVFCEPDRLDENAPPGPLVELGDRIEVRVRPAPADKGVELAARLRDRSARANAPRRLSGNDPQAEVRSALRRAKQLVEVGEVLAVDPAPHGERTPTPGGTLLEAWTRKAPEGGVL
ncbi:hypothetical protein [Nocardioides flavescens]|uniref:hypothetical protein n=1 Tax=Nocardioides flavescens TaxID=2691959 RepID=UPI00192945A3|nr:hypothetical protein [Nocardioides flavescens]